MNLGPMEVIVILGVALLIFGGKKIPELGKGLGDGIRSFKKALSGEPEDPKNPPPPNPPAPPARSS